MKEKKLIIDKKGIFFMNILKDINHSKFSFYYSKFIILIGTVGQCLFNLQANNFYQKESIDNVSIEKSMTILSFPACWLLYGVLVKNKVLIIVNTFSISYWIMASIQLLLIN